MTSVELDAIKKRSFPELDLPLRVPTLDKPLNFLPRGKVYIFECALEMGLRLPIHPFIGCVLAYYGWPLLICPLKDGHANQLLPILAPSGQRQVSYCYQIPLLSRF